MIVLGIFIFFIAIINIIAASQPLACWIAIALQGEHFKISQAVHTDL